MTRFDPVIILLKIVKMWLMPIKNVAMLSIMVTPTGHDFTFKAATWEAITVKI